jgi:hypothetical protein
VSRVGFEWPLWSTRYPTTNDGDTSGDPDFGPLNKLMFLRIFVNLHFTFVVIRRIVYSFTISYGRWLLSYCVLSRYWNLDCCGESYLICPVKAVRFLPLHVHTAFRPWTYTLGRVKKPLQVSWTDPSTGATIDWWEDEESRVLERTTDLLHGVVCYENRMGLCSLQCLNRKVVG